MCLIKSLPNIGIDCNSCRGFKAEGSDIVDKVASVCQITLSVASDMANKLV